MPDPTPEPIAVPPTPPGDRLLETPAVGDELIDLGRTRSTDDLSKLVAMLPPVIRGLLLDRPDLQDLVEVVLDLGRRPEARFLERAEYLSPVAVTRDDLDYTIARVGHFGSDNRAGLEATLHRISALRNRRGETIGLTCRVGRAVFGTIATIRDLVESGKSILMLGRPGVGKTTALREIARVLADDLGKRVVIVDTSNEIAGDGDVPHPAIGRARRMQVSEPELQHRVMIEAVENHMPQVIVIDEIGTELEALAARTIAERGVQLIGTAHGNQLANLIKNPTLSDLVGGIQSVTLGDDEARRRGSQKTVLERKAPPTFEVAVEMQERQRWIIHEAVDETIDQLLRGRAPSYQVRSISDSGEITIERQQATDQAQGLAPASFGNGGREWGARGRGRGDGFGRGSTGGSTAGEPGDRFSRLSGEGWRGTGRMTPLPPPRYPAGRPEFPASFPRPTQELRPEPHEELAALLELPDYAVPPAEEGGAGHLYVYPYAVSRHHLDRAIALLELPVILTKDLDSADAVLALRTHLKNHTKLRLLAKTRQLPIYILKSNSTAQIARTLRRMLKLDDPAEADAAELDLRLFSESGGNDELAALEEARLAVETIVIPKGQPVELLPRSSKVRKMQHELVEHYKLTSTSLGEEPNRRLRIFPA